MAVLGTFDSGYTRTGNGTLTRWANKASFVPFIGGWIAGGLGMIDTVLEAGSWLFKGKFLSAFTVLAAGTVGSATNTLTSGFDGKVLGLGGGGAKALMWWGANAGSGALTGRSMGTHTRALTENVLGGITGALGMKPTVLQSNVAAMGSVPGAMSTRPGQFASAESARRGQNADEAWKNYRNGAGAEHVQDLESARGASAYAGRA